MSLILEALKKSEAERRLGHAPGLMDLQPLARRRRHFRAAWPLAVVLIACVGAGAYWIGQRSQPAPTSSLHASAPAPIEAPPAHAPAAPPSTSTPQTPVPAAPDVDVPQTTPASRLPSDPGFASIEREARPQLPVMPPPAPPATSASTPSDLAAAAPAVPAPTPQAMLPPDAAASAQMTTTQAPAIASPVPISPAAAPHDPVADASLPMQATIPDLASLGPEVRGRLPPLKVSMHVYTEDPTGRVVIIDGRRLREGDALDARLRLAEIRRDGSVVELDGQRYRLPRP